MTATIEIPDPLYEKIAAQSARLGTDLSSLTVRLFHQWVERKAPALEEAPKITSPPATTSERQQALAAWLESAAESLHHAPPGPTARELLLEGRAGRTPCADALYDRMNLNQH